MFCLSVKFHTVEILEYLFTRLLIKTKPYTGFSKQNDQISHIVSGVNNTIKNGNAMLKSVSCDGITDSPSYNLSVDK